MSALDSLLEIVRHDPDTFGAREAALPARVDAAIYALMFLPEDPDCLELLRSVAGNRVVCSVATRVLAAKRLHEHELGAEARAAKVGK